MRATAGGVPLQVLLDVVVAVVASQAHQDPGSTAALLLPAQAAVTHPSADGTRPRLGRKNETLTRVTDRVFTPRCVTRLCYAKRM